MQKVAGVNPLAVERDRHAHVGDSEIPVRDDWKRREVMHADAPNFGEIAKAAIRDHPDRAKRLRNGCHHLTKVGAARRRAAHILDDHDTRAQEPPRGLPTFASDPRDRRPGPGCESIVTVSA